MKSKCIPAKDAMEYTMRALDKDEERLLEAANEVISKHATSGDWSAAVDTTDYPGEVAKRAGQALRVAGYHVVLDGTLMRICWKPEKQVAVFPEDPAPKVAAKEAR
jgi:hypothetical protein